MDCCDFDFKIWLQSAVLYHIWLRQEIQIDCWTLALRFGCKVLCCIIYGLDRKSRLTVVTLTLRFGCKVLCCIIYGLDRKSR